MNPQGSAGAPALGGPPITNPTLGGSATRPQLSAADGSRFSILEYLSRSGDLAAGLQLDPWDPTAGAGDVASFSPIYHVAAAGGTHTSVQSAIDEAVGVGGTNRIYIEVAAGTYREVVCVPSGAPPITLYSLSADAASTVIVYDNYSGKAKAAGASANPCNPNADETTYGTSGSATFASYARDFHAKNLTLANDTNEATLSGAVQAVALLSQGDRVMFDNVRFLGNQDTLSVKTPSGSVTRAYFKNCYVEGDVDFIFGRGTFVLDSCTIHTLTSRNASGVVVAPSTDARNPYGILIIDSTLTAEAGTADGSIHLGRAWDESQGDVATYTANVATGIYPNGQATYKNSTLGSHIAAEPWRSAATTDRPYSSSAGALPANRLYEFENIGPGAAP